MGRNFLAVVVGYIVMALVVFVGLTGAYLAIGADGAFKPGGYEVTTLWLVIMFIDAIVAAILGGITCAKISRSSTGATIALAILIVVLGGVSVAMQAAKPQPTPEQQIRTGDTPNFEAMTNARTPLWVGALNPVIGVLGVLAGAAMVKPRARNHPGE